MPFPIVPVPTAFVIGNLIMVGRSSSQASLQAGFELGCGTHRFEFDILVRRVLCQRLAWKEENKMHTIPDSPWPNRIYYWKFNNDWWVDADSRQKIPG